MGSQLPRDFFEASLPFPLVSKGSGQSPGSRRVSQVNDVAQCPDILVSDAAVALSALQEAHPRLPLLHKHRASNLASARCSPWQRRAIERLRASSGPLLAGWSVPSGKGALADLLRSDDLYAVSGSVALGSCDIEKVRVAKGDLVPKEVATVTSPEAAKLIGAPHLRILKTDSKLRQDTDVGALRGQPCWGAILRGSRAKKLVFFGAPSKAGLLTWRRRVRCRVGCFFAKKKDSMLWLVIDARWANRVCRVPPLSQLAVPGALARLSASDESFGMVQERLGPFAKAELETSNDDELAGFSIDLTDGFYQFKCEALASMFGLGFARVASNIAADFGATIDEVFDNDLQRAGAVQPFEVLEACFLGNDGNGLVAGALLLQ